jgi:hypothetical protein
MLEGSYGIQPDNVSVEFVVPVTTNPEDFADSIMKGKQLVERFLPGHLEVVCEASHIFSPDQLTDPQTLKFGCEPDYNAWTGNVNMIPTLDNPGLRSNGFHIHIGYQSPDPTTSFELIKAMDLFLGLPSLDMDLDNQRRSLYGKAGACRMKPYGVEYRVLSGYFAKSRELALWAAKQTMVAIDFVNSGKPIIMEELIPIAINAGNNSLASEILKNNDILISI